MKTKFKKANLFIVLFAVICGNSCNTFNSNNIDVIDSNSTVTDKSENQLATNQQNMERCFFDNLSNQFNFKINSNDKKMYEVIIYNKSKNEIVQSINSEYTLGDCGVRSYVTGFQKDNEIIDGDYGDLIVDDFNFDGLDDIAIKNDFGNSGAFYNFYMQSKGNEFILDKFLTDEVSHYPLFDKKKKAIILANMVGASHINERYFKYSSNGWILILDTTTELDLQQGN